MRASRCGEGRRQGIVLLSMIVLLLVLMTVAIVFLTLIVSERQLARGASLAARARLLMRSGLEFAAARIDLDPAQIQRNAWSVDNAADDWTCREDSRSVPLRDLTNPSYHSGELWVDDPANNPQGMGIREVGEPLAPGEDRNGNGLGEAFSGRLRGTFDRISDRFRLRIADANDFLHVNMGRLDAADTNGNGVPDHRDSAHPTNQPLKLMLDNLGAILTVSSTIRSGEPTESSSLGTAIVSARPVGGWTAIENLRGVLSDADFGKVRDYLTIAAWVDPTSVWAWENASDVGDWGERRWEPEPRAPIALNDGAPSEVLQAALRYLRLVGQSRNHSFVFTRLGPVDPSEAPNMKVGYPMNFGPNFVVIDPLEAAALAAAIVETRATVQESWDDANGNGVWEPGETYTDTNGNGAYDFGPFETWREFLAFLNAQKTSFDDGGADANGQFFTTAGAVEGFRNLQVDLIHAAVRPDFSLFRTGNRSWYSLEVERDTADPYGWDTFAPRRVTKNQLSIHDTNFKHHARTTEFLLGPSGFFRIESRGEINRALGTIEAAAEGMGVLHGDDRLRITSQEDYENLTAEPAPKGTGSDRVRLDGLRIEGRPDERIRVQTYPKFSQDAYSPDALDPSDPAANTALREYYGYAEWGGSIRMGKRTTREGTERFLLPWNDPSDQAAPPNPAAADPNELTDHLTCEVTGLVEYINKSSFTKFTGEVRYSSQWMHHLFPSGRGFFEITGEIPTYRYNWPVSPLDDGSGLVSQGTIEFWIATDSEMGHWGFFGLDPKAAGERIVVRVDEDRVFADFAGGTFSYFFPAGPSTSLRAWRHVAIRFGTDPNDGMKKFEVFVDGALIPEDLPFWEFTSLLGRTYTNWDDSATYYNVRNFPPNRPLIDDVRGFGERLDDVTISTHASSEIYEGPATYISPRYRFPAPVTVRSASWEGYVPREILAGNGGMKVSLLFYDQDDILIGEWFHPDDGDGWIDGTRWDGREAGVEVEEAASFRLKIVFDGGTIALLQDTPVFESLDLLLDRPLDAPVGSRAIWSSWEERQR